MVFIVAGVSAACNNNKPGKPLSGVHIDAPFTQDYSIKYYTDAAIDPRKSFSDRNGVIKIFTGKGLMQPFGGELLYPGTVVPDDTYRPMTKKNIAGIGLHDNQFVFIDDKAVLSNAWAGTLHTVHQMADARMFAGGEDFGFVVSNGKKLRYIKGEQTGEVETNSDVIDLVYDKLQKKFLVLSSGVVGIYDPQGNRYTPVFHKDSLTCFALSKGNRELVIGTTNGYFVLTTADWQQKGEIHRKLPSNKLTAVAEINNRLWFGSDHGVFMQREDGKFNYYASQRWLPSDDVKHIARGPEGTVLVTTGLGLGQIHFREMTLEAKAAFYDKQVRQRHIRYGLYCDVTDLQNGNLATTQLKPRDSDNLWTGMYLGSQLFRYLATGSREAKQNCVEAFEAMERLYTIHSIPGYFGRSFERHGTIPFRSEYRHYLKDYWYPGYDYSVSWQQAENPEWDWRGASSSDQTVGQMFALTLMAQYMDDEGLKNRAIALIDGLMSHIVDNNLRLIDSNGKPTLWGIWHPEYVNRFPERIGDRKLYSSNIIAFLQTAWHFTKKEKYKTIADSLLYQAGYLENLMRPVSEIGRAPEEADGWSKTLSAEWNHSDDEMYFLAYWGLYPYAFNDSLRTLYRETIKDHWDFERNEKDALWNFCYAMTGADSFDLEESIWHLQEMPLDMIEWSVDNSRRNDLEYITPGFRGETTTEVLPPDERPELKHNRNVFNLKRDAGGRSELGAGDTWLLPYWMGRYLGVISAPENK
ncbi:MAG: hypothetical protein KIT80_04440 [Chitinophagaceae bacterium]|nr:hypothetical protein [Chitinophagaceae bacterium]MCW5926139.1 hypothetical protein [Chitinophagaceae bacterium]